MPLRPASALFALVTTTACAPGLTIRHDSAEDLRDARLDTYALLEPHVGDAALANQHVRPLVERGLDDNGYRQVERSAADLVVTYKVVTAVSQEAAIAADDSFHSKSVVVLIHDARTWDLLWIGWSFEENVKDHELGERAALAAREIMRTVPARLRNVPPDAMAPAGANLRSGSEETPERRNALPEEER